MSFGYFAAVSFTVCICRHPTKKLVTVPAVKREQVSDVDLWPASQPKGKASARLESPIVITSDESGSDQLPVKITPKAKSLSGTIPKALENQRYLLYFCSCLCFC